LDWAAAGVEIEVARAAATAPATARVFAVLDIFDFLCVVGWSSVVTLKT
jgi:hypothetical protein